MNPTLPELTGTFGMVASTHWLASAAGMAELEAGGNGFDAVVAAGFTLQVARSPAPSATASTHTATQAIHSGSHQDPPDRRRRR